jgi:hypothetical protein
MLNPEFFQQGIHPGRMAMVSRRLMPGVRANKAGLFPSSNISLISSYLLKHITMPEKKILTSYSGQTVDELLAMETDYRIDALVFAFEAAIDEKAAQRGYEKLSEAEKAVVAIQALQRDVTGSGYREFFMNTPVYAADIVGLLKLIGCPVTAEVSERAIGALAIKGKISGEAIYDVLQELDETALEKLREFDKRFSGCGEDVTGMLFEFIKQNKNKIKFI